MLSVTSLSEILSCSPEAVSEVAAEYKVVFRGICAEADLLRLRSEVMSISVWDGASVFFEFEHDEGASLYVKSSSPEEDWSRLADSIRECVADGFRYQADIEVKKRVSADGQYVVYCASAFCEWFLKWDASNILATVNSSIEIEGSAPSRVLFPNDAECELCFDGLSDDEERSSMIGKRKSVANIDGFERLLAVPQDFSISSYSGLDTRLVSKLKSLCSMVSLAYMANKSAFSCDSLAFQIRGGSELSGDFRADDDRLFDSGIYELCRWAYVGGEAFDKVEIARSILCSRGDASKVLPVNKDTLSAIKNSYRLYLRENAKEYLHARNKLSNAIGEYCDHVAACVSGFVGDFKKNLVAILGYVTTMLLVRQVSTPTPGFFTAEIAQVSAFVLAVSCIFGIVSWVLYCIRVSYYKGMITAMCESLNDIFSNDEMKRLVDEHPQRMKSLRYYWLCSILLLILWLIICIAFFLLLDYLSGDELLLFAINFL